MGGGRYERVDCSTLKTFRLTILFTSVIFMFFCSDWPGYHWCQQLESSVSVSEETCGKVQSTGTIYYYIFFNCWPRLKFMSFAVLFKKVTATAYQVRNVHCIYFDLHLDLTQLTKLMLCSFKRLWSKIVSTFIEQVSRESALRFNPDANIKAHHDNIMR